MVSLAKQTALSEMFPRDGPKIALNRVMPGVHLNWENNLFYECPIGGNPTFFNTFDSMFTILNSNGTYFDSAGHLQSASANTSRVTYDINNPDTNAGQFWGLLCENAATNLALWSRDLTNAAWALVTMTAAQTSTGLDGAANSCTRLTATAGNATVLQTLVASSVSRVLSFYVKRITGVGNIQTTQDGSTWVTHNPAASGWTRISSAATTALNPVFGLRIVTSGDAIDVDCCQLEATGSGSSGSRTTPIITTTVAVTRAADSYTRTYANSVPSTLIVDRVNSQGTYYGKIYFFDILGGVGQGIICSGTDLATFGLQGAGKFTVVNNTNATNTSPAIYTLTRGSGSISIGSNFNTWAVAQDGGGTKIAASGTSPNGFATLWIGNRSGIDRSLNGSILRCDYWPFIGASTPNPGYLLSGSELQALSGQG